ncbi:MAG: FAD:protein FMN transferase [Candidatus Omnitrophica bacterium]|nr:FAD:protein FMN transferase [Candidatus Omnitrophota bacterium]
MQMIGFRWSSLCLGFCFGLAMAGCQSVDSTPALQRFTYAELHMATVFRIVMYAPDQAAADHGAELAFNRIKALDDMMTDYDPQSELMRLCRQPAGTPVQVSSDLFDILAQSKLVSETTGGAFDVTVGPIIRLWRTARKTRVLPTEEAVSEARRAVGCKRLVLDFSKHTVTLTVPGMKLDLGGIAKGLAADQALAILKSDGLDRAMVAASGDIALGAPPPGRSGWSIGIASIDHPEEGLTREVKLRNAAVSTSGDTEQYVEINGRRYSHIVNPETGMGLTERIGVTIVAPNATTSDSLATAVSVLGARRGLELVESLPRTAALIVMLSKDGKQAVESSRFKRIEEK